MDRASNRWSSARGALVLGFGALVVLVGGLVGWSVLASIRGAVFVTGWVATEGRNQVVEHIDGGTVREIRVRDGDRVEAGELLLRLDDALLRSEEAILQAQHAELVARRNRLEAEFLGADRVAWAPELARLAAADPRIQEVLTGQERLFRARDESRMGEVARMRERIGQAREEIAGLEARAVSLVRQAELIAEELAAKRRLVEQGAMQKSVLLELERGVSNLEGQTGANDAAIARAAGRIAEYEILVLQIDTKRIEEAEEQAREVQARENELWQQLASVRERLGRLDVHAPVAGEVFGLTVFAAREVVRPGEPILHIVPAGADLVVMAQLDPIDVDQVYPGQSAALRFSAFPARTTSEFSGSVKRISADAVRDPDTGRSWYLLEVAIGGPIDHDDGTLPTFAAPDLRRSSGGLDLTPGMPVEVHVQTGQRSPISYLAKPLTDYFLRSLREE
ncbi:MAG: HlyD family type I secretion periplasmic adaptor subunit [Spirochaetaceae bacterium]|nr:HlyD family type I secretion periplasmic adaptor subunit [Spirochaetaceae bacterium]